MWQTSALLQTSRLLLLTERRKRKKLYQQTAKVCLRLQQGGLGNRVPLGFIGNKDFLLTDIGNWYQGNDCKRADDT